MPIPVRGRDGFDGGRTEYLAAADRGGGDSLHDAHGENAGGTWDAKTETAEYDRTPDKESPLWDTHSKVIYYWTADTVPKNEKQAYIIVYNGGVYARTKTNSQAYLSFRAVKEAE